MTRIGVCAALLLALGCSSDEGASGSAGGSGNAGSGGAGNASSGGAGNASSGGAGNASSGGAGNASSGGTGNASSGGSGGSTARSCSDPDPAWLLCEDFEGMSAGFDAWFAASPWTEALGENDRGRLTSSDQAHGGSYALYMPAEAGSGYQGADLIYRTCAGENRPGCTLSGHQTLYFRAYFRLAPDHQYVHHFLSLGGSQESDYWSSYGNAGCRPNGERHMGTTVDFNQNHETFFYTYYPEMNCDPGATCNNYADAQSICDGCATKGMPCDNGLECCWGNHFRPSPEVVLPLDEWVCFEMMMRANDVGQSNGEMTYWINGQLGHSVSDMHFRDVDTLTVNQVRLQHYVTTGDANGHSNRIWFDDVVVSTERIGCN